jgi:DNA topoisomerase I
MENKKRKILIFLESNTKKKTVKSFLGDDYEIFATGGHLLELENSGTYNIGVNLQNFKPKYVVIERKKTLVNFFIKYLKENETSQIFLATDPDREGEAISREIVEILKLQEGEYKRLLFHEITFSGITSSLENPTDIDKNLVDAQLSRQVLDKMIGFCLSKTLQRKINAWSAGRVQSVVLKLIVERELEIKNYGDKKEFILFALYKLENKIYHLNEKEKDGNLKTYKSIEDAENSKKMLSGIFKLENKNEQEKTIFPKYPFTTSTLLFEAKNKLNFSISKTTELAQQLYEGITLANKKRISLITYPRTDSTRISKVFANKAYTYIESKWNKDLCNFSKKFSLSSNKNKENVQDAHEAIRPTYLEQTPEELENKAIDKDQLKLYALIFNNAIASFMQPAKYLNKVYKFSNNDKIFEMTENVIINPGFFTFIDEAYEANKIMKNSIIRDKDLKEIKTKEFEIEEYTWNIPRRYTEGTIIKTLEKLGIGRPSTYNSFTNTIIKRRYSKFEKKGTFIPTELGFKVNEWLQKNFPSIINESYTATLEKDLDKIGRGENTYISFISTFWNNFFPNYKKIDEK